nr:MAG TPA: minor tail protein [Caudoviricetes sp.]
MMDNYERVEELQQISERSAGATAAQLTKYREGLEASRNNLKVAWEKIVESFANSDFFIGLIKSATTLLDIFNKLTQNEFVKGTIFAAVGVALANVIAKKKITNDLAREELELETEQRIDSIKAQQKAIEDQKKAEVDQKIAIQQRAYQEAQAHLDDLEAQKKSLEADKAKEIAANDILRTEKEISAEKDRQAKLATEAAKMDVARWQIKNGSAAEVEQGKNTLAGHTRRASKITRDYNTQVASLNAIHDSNEAAINNKYAESENNITEAIAAQTEVVNKAKDAADEAAKSREKNINDALAQDKEYKASQDALQLLQAKGNSLLKGSLVLYSLRTTITSFWNKTQKLSIAIRKKLAAATAKDAVATTADTVAKGANTVATNKLKVAVNKLTAARLANPVGLIVAGLVALGAIIAGIVIAVNKAAPSIKNVAKAVGTLTNEVYELNKSNTAIDNAISK